MGDNFAAEFIANCARRAARIEQTNMGRALTPEEVKSLKVDALLRKIAPYCYEKSQEGGTK